MKILIHHIMREDWHPALAASFPEHAWALSDRLENFAREISDTDILLITNRACTKELGEILRARACALKWIHFLTAGMDNAIAMGLPENVAISHAAGVKAASVAEHAMALLLALRRRLPDILTDQRQHLWRREEISAVMGSLTGTTSCIVGLGHVGREIARKLRAFDAVPIAVSRAGAPDDLVASVYPRERLHEALGLADSVIVATSADESSRRLIDGSALAAMKRGAVLVNIARGSLVDESALIAALVSGRLAGAGLDVQKTEPLPPSSPLWDLPQVIISPHSAGAGASGYQEHRALFAANLERFCRGDSLINSWPR